MEILRWTGRPGMALVNRIGTEDHAAEWHRALNQYFKIVRDFDAFSVSFEERVHLLHVFRELRPDWRAGVDEAVGALVAQRGRRRGEAAAIVTELLVDAVTHTEELAVEDEAAIEEQRDRLERSFHDALRARGGRAPPDRGAVRPPGGALRGGGRPRAPGLPAGPVRRGGVEAPRALSRAARRGRRARWRCARRSGGRGGRRGQHLRGDGPRRRAGRRGRAVRRRPALRARAIDRAAGIPGLLVDVQRYWSGARRFRIGPHAQPNFAWVLLDRALLHYDSVARRTHARAAARSRCRARRARRHRGGVRARRAACPRDALSPAQARPARSSALGPRRARASDRPHPSPCRSCPGGGANARKPPSRAGRRLHADGLHGGDAAIDLSSMEGSILHRAFTAAEEAPLSRTPSGASSSAT